MSTAKYWTIFKFGAFLVISALISIFFSWFYQHNYLINLDSYEFLYIATYDFHENNPTFNFFNRIGYGEVLKSSGQIFCQAQVDSYPNCLINISRISNDIFIVAISLMIFIGIYLYTRNYLNSALGSIIWGTHAWTGLVGSSVLNDIFALFCLSLYLALLYCKRDFSISKTLKFIRFIGNILLIAFISTIRIEYTLILLPLIIFHKISKKEFFSSLLAIILINTIFILPYQLASLTYFGTNWLELQFNSLRTLTEYWYYWALGSIIIMIIPFVKKFAVSIWNIASRYRYIILACIFAFLFVLFNIIESWNFSNFFLNSNLIIIILFLSILFASHISNLAEKGSVNSKLKYLLLSIILLLYIFYRTNYFHHLIIVIFALSIFIGTFVDDIWSFAKTSNLQKNVFKVLLIIILVLSNAILWSYTIKPSSMDLAQKVYIEAQDDLIQNSENKSETLIISNFNIAFEALSNSQIREYNDYIYIYNPELINITNVYPRNILLSSKNIPIKNSYNEIVIYTFNPEIYLNNETFTNYVLAEEKEIKITENNPSDKDFLVEEDNLNILYRKTYKQNRFQ